MTEHMYLVGTEDITRAAATMRMAGHEMSMAAQSIGAALEQHQRFLDNWLVVFREAILHPATPQDQR